MTLREFFWENFAGDLEYHPRRAVLYLALSAAALCSWIFAAPEIKFRTTPLVFGLGSLTLLLKGIFLLRKSSEGLGLTQFDFDALSDSSHRKSLPSIPNQSFVKYVTVVFNPTALALNTDDRKRTHVAARLNCHR